MSSTSDRKLSKNAEQVRSAIDNLSECYNNHNNSWSYGEFWGRVDNINQLFEELDLKDRDREELWAKLGDYCDKVKEAMGAESDKKQNNAEKIRRRVDGLSQYYSIFKDEWRYEAFWDEVEEINDMFSNMRLEDDERDKLWSELQDYCSRVKKSMEKEEAKKQSQSKRRRELVLRKINKVSSMVSEAEDVDEWRKAKSALFKIQEWMKSGWDAADIHIQMLHDLMGNEGYFSEEDWRKCQDRWNEVKDEVNRKYDWICKINRKKFKKNYVKDIANESTTGDPYEAIEMIKSAQKELHSGKAFKDVYFEEFKSKLEKYWDRASKRIEKKKRKKKQEWKSDMRSHIRRWENTIEKQEKFIDKKEREIKDLEREKSNAKSQEHENRVENWIQKKRGKIREASNNISRMQDKISDVKRKISD